MPLARLLVLLKIDVLLESVKLLVEFPSELYLSYQKIDLVRLI